MEGSRITEVRESHSNGTLTHAERVVTPENVILLCTVGSTVHGLALEGTDDQDEMGIVLEPQEYVIGLDLFEQRVSRTKPEGVRSEAGDLDQVIYSARKYCRLALSGNPTILLLLFAPVKISTPAGESLRENAHWFSARSAGKAFLGYMTQQRQRLLGERGQKNVKRPELVARYGYDTKYAMHMIRLGFQGVEFLETGRLSLPMPDYERAYTMGIRRGEVGLDDVLTMAGTLERKVEDLLDHSPLPDRPNRDAVTQWLIETYEQHWSPFGAGSS